MKNYIKKLIMLSLLSVSTLALSMEEPQDKQNPDELLENLSLPNETWALILQHVYFNPSILNEANDIYEGIAIIQEYIPACLKTTPLVCKTFRALNINISQDQWGQFKKEIRKFYIPHLNQIFLEEREGKKGFYPKSGEWVANNQTNQTIAQLVANRSIQNKEPLCSIIALPRTENFKLINVLLFYGVDPNIQDDYGWTFLNTTVYYHHPTEDNKIELIKLLLQHGANPNLQDNLGWVPLMRALEHHHSIGQNMIEAIKLLLRYNANPYIKNEKRKTAFNIARANDFTEFEQLVRTHSQNTLKKICLQYILTNLSLFEGQLDRLPLELQDTINNLKS